MKTKLSIVVLLVLALTALLVGAVGAQGPRLPGPPPPSEMPPAPEWPPFPGPEGKPFAPFAAAPEVEAQSVGAASIPLGQPGTVFRYVQTFGFTEEGYFEDSSHFYNPSGVATDGTSVWIADSYGNRVVKFDAGGTFLQQIDKASFREATGISLNYIHDLAVDSSGNIWVVDGDAHHVVKYSSTGQRISELGGAWDPGSDNNRFDTPIGIAFDSAGYIYVSDSGNHRIQIFDSSNQYVATLGQTDNPGPSNGQFREPRRIAIYGDRLYVADAGNHRVQIFDITNPASPSHIATLGQTGSPGSGNNQFNYPEGLAADASYIYVADSNNNRVQIFNRASYAYVATIGGSSGSGNNQFRYPTDVAADTAGNIYVADIWNNRVQQYNSSWQYVRTYGTTGVPYVTDGYHYNYPTGVAIAADGSIYIVEKRGKRLVKLDASGVPQWTVGEPGVSGDDNSHFRYPEDVALDNSGRVYVADSANDRIQIYTSSGDYYATLGERGTGNYQFKSPHGLAVGQNGYLYVADRYNHRVQVYGPNLAFVGTIGQTGVPGSADNQFNEPYDVAVDSSNNVYVVDLSNHRVQKCAPAGGGWACTTFAGETGVPGSDFGHLRYPIGITIDGAGRVYVADGWGWRVQVFDSSGAYLTTIGGSSGNRSGQMRQADGLAVDSAGNLYIAEYLNHRIQKFAPGVPGWKQVNINGFGERANRINSLAPFGGSLYAGTFSFGGNGAQLWRMDPGGNWTSVMTNGFGNAANVGIDHLLEFNGQLYAGTRNYTNAPPYSQGGEVWRSSDGITWTRVVSQGFGDSTNSEVRRLAAFNGQLYAGTWSYTNTHGAEIWRSDTGNAGDWEQVVSNGLSGPANMAIMTMEEFNGALYAGTYSYIGESYDGADVWRTTDGLNWTAVITNGFGYTDTYAVSALEPFGGYLYAGIGRYDFSTNSYPGGQIWRCAGASGCDEPADWQEVTGGWAKPENYSIDSLLAFDGYLYAVASNYTTGLEVWRTADGTTWEQVGFAGLGDSNNTATYNSAAVFNNRFYLGTNNWANGGEVWKKTVTADFTASPTAGSPGATVTFTNLSGGDIITATWDFGDGSPPLVSNAATVQHTYTQAGTYSVSLAVTDGVDTDTRTRPAYIQIAHRVYLPLVMRNYNPLMALYDDFDDPAFNGFYNPLKWQFWGDANYFSAQQQGGVMQITNTPSTPANKGLDLPLAMPLGRTLRQVQRFQARMKLSSGTSGTGAKIQIMKDENGSGWWAKCSLTAYSGQPDFGCDIVNYTPGNYPPEYAVGWPGPLAFDTWYTARIEINPDTAEICFYLDNNQLGCHIPSNANALKVATNLVPRIGSWNGQAGATGTRYFDDVSITPAGP